MVSVFVRSMFALVGRSGGEAMLTRCGSPGYIAPEASLWLERLQNCISASRARNAQQNAFARPCKGKRANKLKREREREIYRERERERERETGTKGQPTRSRIPT